MLRITEMRKVGNAIRAKEINGSWFEHGRLRMEGDYKLGLETTETCPFYSPMYTYICTYIGLGNARHLLPKHPSFVSRSKSHGFHVLEMTRNRHLRGPP